MKSRENINMLAYLRPDFMGFIFANESPRKIELTPELINEIRGLNCHTVGVFVNEKTSKIVEMVEKLRLDYVQLHGNESPDEIEALKPYCKVMKAFAVHREFDFDLVNYDQADLLLFDSKGLKAGGNGTKFNWNLLRAYKGNVPFMLSGGLKLEDVNKIRQLSHDKLIGIDVNSGFELSPGIKNIDLIAQLKLELDEVLN